MLQDAADIEILRDLQGKVILAYPLLTETGPRRAGIEGLGQASSRREQGA